MLGPKMGDFPPGGVKDRLPVRSKYAGIYPLYVAIGMTERF